MDQYTIEVCVLELHPKRDVVHSLLMVNKEEVIERGSGHCSTTFDKYHRNQHQRQVEESISGRCDRRPEKGDC